MFCKFRINTLIGRGRRWQKGGQVRVSNRVRVLEAAVNLFNQRGVVPVTTNHICQHLEISPGNLYFHFRGREDIILELFNKMCEETYVLWRNEERGQRPLPPLQFIQQSLEIFWQYRFFHREMYFLRRQDPRLSDMWHLHLRRTRRLLRAAYGRWIRCGWVLPVEDPNSFTPMRDLILVTASSFFQFYESLDRPATRRPLLLANQYLESFLWPRFTSSYKNEILAERENGVRAIT